MSESRHRVALVRQSIVLLLAGTIVGGCAGDGWIGRVSPVSREALVERGRTLFQQQGCMVCHGPEGRGDGPTAHALETRPTNLRRPSAYRQGASVDAVTATLASGVRGSTQMPPYAHLPVEDRTALAEFIVSRQEGAGAPEAEVP